MIRQPMVARDAAPMLDAMISALVSSGHSFALMNTTFRFDNLHVRIKPTKEDREVVFEAAVKAFADGGWHYGSRMADPEDEPSRPVVEMTFRHPRTNTRLGQPIPPRPQRLGFEINLPDPSQPLTRETIEYYTNYASEIARSLLEEQADKELLFRPIPVDDDQE